MVSFDLIDQLNESVMYGSINNSGYGVIDESQSYPELAQSFNDFLVESIVNDHIESVAADERICEAAIAANQYGDPSILESAVYTIMTEGSDGNGDGKKGNWVMNKLRAAWQAIKKFFINLANRFKVWLDYHIKDSGAFLAKYKSFLSNPNNIHVGAKANVYPDIKIGELKAMMNSQVIKAIKDGNWSFIFAYGDELKSAGSVLKSNGINIADINGAVKRMSSLDETNFNAITEAFKKCSSTNVRNAILASLKLEPNDSVKNAITERIFGTEKKKVSVNANMVNHVVELLTAGSEVNTFKNIYTSMIKGTDVILNNLNNMNTEGGSYAQALSAFTTFYKVVSKELNIVISAFVHALNIAGGQGKALAKAMITGKSGDTDKSAEKTTEKAKDATTTKTESFDYYDDGYSDYETDYNEYSYEY